MLSKFYEGGERPKNKLNENYLSMNIAKEIDKIVSNI